MNQQLKDLIAKLSKPGNVTLTAGRDGINEKHQDTGIIMEAAQLAPLVLTYAVTIPVRDPANADEFIGMSYAKLGTADHTAVARSKEARPFGDLEASRLVFDNYVKQSADSKLDLVIYNATGNFSANMEPEDYRRRRVGAIDYKDCLQIHQVYLNAMCHADTDMMQDYMEALDGMIHSAYGACAQYESGNNKEGDE